MKKITLSCILVVFSLLIAFGAGHMKVSDGWMWGLVVIAVMFTGLSLSLAIQFGIDKQSVIPRETYSLEEAETIVMTEEHIRALVNIEH